ncbi:MAG: phosphoglycolate phosphatase [Acidocella sp. 20-57-95]|nr:MAG: phosphoglycolate phosphatase [Acidocella sp. 20-57-95]OYV58493.1 MAG: phosphoglycolate phosphatase [Acidocella sp. 21-58-7]HQT65586.1 HAD-IA family hydrolase [Acidocella sp.]HQU04387.1 HAD-IA family hydrolase [Acidocella sp.]
MRAIIFDLDGTLIDSLPDIAAAANHVLSKRGLPPLTIAQVKPMVGDGGRALLSKAFAVYGQISGEDDYEVFETYYTAHASALTVIYPGIEEILQNLQAAGHRLGVCTNKPEAAARAVLHELGLAGYFQTVMGGNSTPYRKPDPRHLAATLASLNVDDAIMIGDHHNDLAAAEGLGLPAIFVSWGYGAAEHRHVAHAAQDIQTIIKNLAR